MRRVVLFILLSGLISCGPVYQTDTHYIPPADAQGKACAINCEERRTACRDQCDIRYEACMKEAELQGKIDYLAAKEKYLDDKADCLAQSVHDPNTPRNQSRCKGTEPRLDSFVQDVRCDQNCGCETDFERCFEICGGTIRRERYCVSGCE